MTEHEPKTAGIPPATRGALQVLQFATPDNADMDPERVAWAAHEVATYHAPVGDQAERHKMLSAALAEFLSVMVAMAPPGPERSTAISRAREAKMWASAAIALEGR